MPLIRHSPGSQQGGLPTFGLDLLAAVFSGRPRGSDPIRNLLSAGVCAPGDGLAVLRAELERARRYRRPLSLILLQAGAIRLERSGLRPASASAADLGDLGQLLLRRVRATDGIAVDPGCGQFMLTLPETDLPGACAVVRRLETAIATSLALTVRWGLAQFPSCALTVEGLVHYALTGLDAEEVGALEVAIQQAERERVGVA